MGIATVQIRDRVQSRAGRFLCEPLKIDKVSGKKKLT
jgi:hypothetical protein